jgi:hypothetical protein
VKWKKLTFAALQKRGVLMQSQKSQLPYLVLLYFDVTDEMVDSMEALPVTFAVLFKFSNSGPNWIDMTILKQCG